MRGQPHHLGLSMVRSQPKLLLRAISESVATQWQGLVSMAHITTREHGNVHGQGSHWGLFGCPGAVHNWSHSSLDVVF